MYPQLRDLRDDHDKTPQELTASLHVTQTTYSKYELGKVSISIEVFIRLAEYYNVSIDYLVGRTNNKKVLK